MKWIGTKPNCVSTRAEGEEDDEGEEEEDEEGDYGEEDEEAEEDGADQGEGEKHIMSAELQPTSTTKAAEHTMMTEGTTERDVTHHEREDRGEEIEDEIVETHPTEGRAELPAIATNETTDDSENEDDTEVDGEDMTENHVGSMDIHGTITTDGFEGENLNSEIKHDHKVTDKEDEDDTEAEDEITTKDPRESTTIAIHSCGSNRGGCDHECQVIYHENGVRPIIQCSCYHGFSLDPHDSRTCHDINECEQNNGGCDHICTNKPGSFECSCPPGLQIDVLDGRSCIDIDECAEQDHGCEHCRNAYGGYECTCPVGFELADDDRTCRDVNECEAYGGEVDYDEEEPVERVPVSVCSHTCVNTVGSFECSCPESFHLNHDRRTCVRDFCADLYENPNKTKCSHECKDGAEGFVCKCPEFHILDEYDRKTCLNVYSCGEAHKNRCEPGVCRILEGGDYRCECPSGYQTHDHSCHDVDECELRRHGCSHDCHNTGGSYDCSCPRGLQLSSVDNRTCEDVNECEVQKDEGLCGDLQCTNTHGSYKCVCPEGKDLDEYGICRQMDLCTTDNGGCSHICTFFNRETFCDCPDKMELDDDGKTCVAINECDLNNGGCSHICDSESESLCKCPYGYTLGSDARTCHDVDECRDKNGGCEHQCLNHDGGYECGCSEGFELAQHDNRSCSDIDECAGQNSCDHTCHNTEGFYYCSCHSGYNLADNGHSCSDINECDVHNGDCSHICVNLLGSHECSCPAGQYLLEDGRSCEFVNECELNNGGCSHSCNHVKGVITCSCPNGFELDKETFKTCIDVNECDHDNGGCSHSCSNYPGSYRCSCPEGYELSRDQHTCEDIDECIENNGNCSNICINLFGDFKCACEAGFELEDDQRSCRDVDECTARIHDCSHVCVNVPGTYECECPAGYTLGRDKLSCEDIDECETLPDRAGCEHQCINTPGLYRCACEDGHRLERDNRTCSDVDECADETRKCSHDCVNTKGSFECSCPSGLRLSIDGVTCVDVDECRINSFNGGCSHICENQHGSFECRCPSGWIMGSDQATCEDVDECSVLNGGCSQRCINSRGGFRCECEAGFALMADNKTCEVVDPCALRNGGCQHYCSLKHGLPVCSCREGFVLNKTNMASCVDHDECLKDSDNNCQQKCVNSEGSFNCECYAGYVKNELGQCLDLNECLEGNGGCGANSRCVNLAGSFRCLCLPGFKMAKDRRTCHKIKDNCKPLKAPVNGEIRCSKSRHKTDLFYRSKCSITCKKGFKLLGPSVRYCNGTGQWDEGESLCVAQACPRLQRPEHGTILPSACMNGKIYAGERCVLHCKPGFKPAGKRTTVCDTEQNWTPTPKLHCIPAATPAPVPIKPYIQCPSDIQEVLPYGEHTIRIRLEQPKSNVDWYKYVDAHPAWGKQLEAELPAGETSVTFRARSPNSNMNDICRVLIRIRERKPPQVVNCPESFNVRLEENEHSRSIYWAEPTFETEAELKQLYKSHSPGQVMIAGIHYVNYVATDADGLSAKCSFAITVEAVEVRRVVHRPLETNRLENHESYLICPGKSPLPIDPNALLHIPQGCVVKNIRIKQKLARLRHQQQIVQQHLKELEEAPNPDRMAIQQQERRYNNLLRFYSTWDNVYSRQQQYNHFEDLPYHQFRAQHPRRWFKKRSKDNEHEQRTKDTTSVRNQQEEIDAAKP
ncbi:fibrillin-2-like isoform X2 [Toxorhynchites rutilus septentrionalis]|uniref:fibrillin-2-like isoform X2 n=1 Tax=Toxorhynchites rutilus septentrionalis TaxID=329112 RepID=UPI00247A8AA6|nr:fibrillin-2-like isoform X2 [Toxorhynchites rutilus septentrionalis]